MMNKFNDVDQERKNLDYSQLNTLPGEISIPMKILALILQISIPTRHLYLKQDNIMPLYIILKKIISDDFMYLKRVKSNSGKLIWRKRNFIKF